MNSDRNSSQISHRSKELITIHNCDFKEYQIINEYILDKS